MENGATRCGCGYDRVTASTGRPQLGGTIGLPTSPLLGRGINFGMMLGALLCLGGIGLAVTAYLGIFTNFSHPYLVAAGAIAMGCLRYGRGAAQCRND